MKFIIYEVENGFVLQVVYSPKKIKTHIFKPTERMTMLALVDKIIGEEPDDAIGKELENSN